MMKCSTPDKTLDKHSPTVQFKIFISSYLTLSGSAQDTIYVHKLSFWFTCYRFKLKPHMATNSPLWAEVQWVVHAVLETGWAQIRSRVISRCGGRSVDGGSAQTGSTTGTSLQGTCDKKTLRLRQVLYLMHHTWKKKGQILASNMVWS